MILNYFLVESKRVKTKNIQYYATYNEFEVSTSYTAT